MHDLNFSLQLYCSDKYSVTTVCTAEAGMRGESEMRENFCGPLVFKLQVDLLSIYINIDANIFLCEYIYACMFIHTNTHI